jgi:hypothetical protein
MEKEIKYAALFVWDMSYFIECPRKTGTNGHLSVQTYIEKRKTVIRTQEIQLKKL